MTRTKRITVPHFFTDDIRHVLYVERVEAPLFPFWARKYQVAEQVIGRPTRQFRVDFTHEEPLDPSLSEIGTQVYWSIGQEHSSYREAHREFFDIAYLYTYASRGMRRHYHERKDRLVQEGYPEAEIEHVREPLAEIPALHLGNGCIGEIHVGRVSHRRDTPLFCTACGQIFALPGAEPVCRDQLEDIGPHFLPQNPDSVVYPLDMDETFGPGTKERDEIGLAYMHRCLKHLGKLISISEAAIC